jgi:hypothetical protein
VVERAEEQHRVPRRISYVQAACVADDRAEPSRGELGRLLDVERHRIDEPNLVADVGEPRRICARTAADVQHAGRCGRQEAREQLLRPLELDAGVALREAVALEPELVVPADVLVHGRKLKDLAAVRIVVYPRCDGTRRDDW